MYETPDRQANLISLTVNPRGSRNRCRIFALPLGSYCKYEDSLTSMKGHLQPVGALRSAHHRVHLVFEVDPVPYRIILLSCASYAQRNGLAL